MKSKTLGLIRRSLRAALLHIGRDGLSDRDIRHRYAEFLVAHKLAKRRHSVQVLAERDDRSADIYLPGIDVRVEVKSCKAYNDPGELDWAYASFGTGVQISKHKFDYCVFVVFKRASDRVKEILVFTWNELRTVAKKRKNLAAHEDTNPCLLVCAPSLREYEEKMKLWNVKQIEVEKEIRRNPRRYVDAWQKIK